MKLYLYLDNVIHDSRIDSKNDILKIYVFTESMFSQYSIKKLAGLETKDFFVDGNQLELFVPVANIEDFSKNIGKVNAIEFDYKSFSSINSFSVAKDSLTFILNQNKIDETTESLSTNLMESQKSHIDALVTDETDKAEIKRIFEKYGI